MSFVLICGTADHQRYGGQGNLEGTAQPDPRERAGVDRDAPQNGP